MGGGEHGNGDWRAKVWSIPGGPNCRLKHWRRNTAIALLGCFLVCIPVAIKSAQLEFLSLYDSEAAFNLEVIRDCYEAFALYCFERYLIACLALYFMFLIGVMPFVMHKLRGNQSSWLSFLLGSGGEEKTIEFMKSQSIISTGTPLLEESYSFGVVEHPFPLNCCLREWYHGEDFYQAVKIGIVQYVSAHMVVCNLVPIVYFALSFLSDFSFELSYCQN